MYAVGAHTSASPSEDYFSADCALALLDAGADPNIFTEMEVQPLPLCALRKEGVGTDAERLTMIRALLEKGAAMDGWMYNNLTPQMNALQAAVYTGFYEAAKLLIDAGAEVNPPHFAFYDPPAHLFGLPRGPCRFVSAAIEQWCRYSRCRPRRQQLFALLRRLWL
jgi:ankyrin repeat protein